MSSSSEATEPEAETSEGTGGSDTSAVAADEFATLGLTARWGSVRREIVIECAPDAAWARIADVANNASWFTGVTRSWCERDPDTGKPVRKVQMPTGIVLTEDIILVDAAQRRLQYALRPLGPFTYHLATIDVLELPPHPSGTPWCLVVYSTDLSPRPISLAFAGAAERGLETLKQQLEADPQPGQ
jgi:hypothetical protein